MGDNDVLNDPGVKDKEWAQREKFVSFAGFALCWGGGNGHKQAEAVTMPQVG